jgi:amidohydrolase
MSRAGTVSRALTKEELKARVCDEIDTQSDRIVAIGDAILRTPETGFREVRTARRVSDEFDAMGLASRDGLAHTGVQARMRGGSSRRTVAILGELDALPVPDHPFADPVTGAAHACGHNAQIASMIGAGIGLQAVIEQLAGDVVLFAVPGEECVELDWRLRQRDAGELEFVAGKAELLRLGAFDDVDLALMTHSGVADVTSHPRSMNGALVKRARFRGRASHAGAAPWEGVNAFKALTLALAAIDAQRDTFRDEDAVRVHQLVTQAGEAENVVPASAQMQMMVRARTVDAMHDASGKVDRALRAGVLAMGAQVEISTIAAYLPLTVDESLAAVVHDNVLAVCTEDQVVRDAGHLSGSTDLGDLSHVMPVVHPMAASGNAAPFHSSGYYATDLVRAALNPAKFMAMTVVDLLCEDASEAERVIERSGPKLTREQYVAARRAFDGEECFGDGPNDG